MLINPIQGENILTLKKIKQHKIKYALCYSWFILYYILGGGEIANGFAKA